MPFRCFRSTTAPAPSSRGRRLRSLAAQNGYRRNDHGHARGRRVGFHFSPGGGGGVGERRAVLLRQARRAEQAHQDGERGGGEGQGGQGEVGGDGPPELQGGLRHDGQ